MSAGGARRGSFSRSAPLATAIRDGVLWLLMLDAAEPPRSRDATAGRIVASQATGVTGVTRHP